jgi:DNA glycosylase AlkZ-like
MQPIETWPGARYPRWVTDARPRIDGAERRARLGLRHHLAPSAIASTAIEAAADLIGLHGSDPISVYLAAWARVDGLETRDLDRALYDDRSLLKILGMRRTMFVLPIEVAGVVQAACTETIATGERKRLVRMIEDAGIAANGERWLAGVESETVEALHHMGEATAADLTKEVAGLREQIQFGAGKKWQGRVGVSTRLLFLLAAEGRIIRGRPKGTLVSSLYRWTPMDRWVPGGLPLMPAEPARVDLLRRWLTTFGPGTLRDIQWWVGWTVTMVKRTLAEIRPVEVELDGGSTGYLLADDLEPVVPPAGPWVALLPALDPTIMGWQERAWYLGEHGKRVFDTNGNAGPMILLDGRVVGGWAQRRDGDIAFRLLEDVGSEAAALVAARAATLRDWLGDLRFIPRFRTPLEQELSA